MFLPINVEIKAIGGDGMKYKCISVKQHNSFFCSISTSCKRKVLRGSIKLRSRLCKLISLAELNPINVVKSENPFQIPSENACTFSKVIWQDINVDKLHAENAANFAFVDDIQLVYLGTIASFG